ncbi:GntR family transcriptional regulator [Paroceanicella profunda]|uniref:GntR family transcriptional regulator n=1 Tax=Paroceanicella profunda TaxID=2579971 RepID=A0A5B8FTL8_9RHOB|nr:GntR family transcriptional regulator [Paroceanicella profunda]QDL91715.1 GntR family transcriptional regulator [Paroceanicella profunda]
MAAEKNADGQAAEQTFRPLESDDLATRIAGQIVEAIGDGRLRPGEKVTELRLSKEMGTSRAPVREALRLLESQGLIVSHPRRGFFVHAYGTGELEEIYDLRLCLELHAAQRALERLTSADIDRLEAQVALMYRLGRAGATHEQVAADYAFHRMVCEIGGNERIVRLFDTLATEMRSGIALIGSLYDDPVHIAETHDPIVAALRNRDPEDLHKRLRAHITDARTQVIRLFEKTRGPDA